MRYDGSQSEPQRERYDSPHEATDHQATDHPTNNKQTPCTTDPTPDTRPESEICLKLDPSSQLPKTEPALQKTRLHAAAAIDKKHNPKKKTHFQFPDPPTIDRLAELFPALEIIKLVGTGGMGAVYKARQPGLDRFVALKILP